MYGGVKIPDGYLSLDNFNNLQRGDDIVFCNGWVRRIEKVSSNTKYTTIHFLKLKPSQYPDKYTGFTYHDIKRRVLAVGRGGIMIWRKKQGRVLKYCDTLISKRKL